MSAFPSDLASFLWGIGLGVIGAFAAGFLKRAGEDSYTWIKNKINPKAIDPMQPQVIVHLGNNDVQSLTSKSNAALTPATVERISEITFQEISKTIENAPPLQREQIAKNYLGLQVEWDAYFCSGYRDKDDNIDLRLSASPNRTGKYVRCTVRLSDYRELGLLPENSKVRVSGKITDADRFDVTLSDVRLHFYRN